jgi:hypothetical protein
VSLGIFEPIISIDPASSHHHTLQEQRMNQVPQCPLQETIESSEQAEKTDVEQ